MKKTTRNYIWILAANAMLIIAIAVFWQFRLKADTFKETEFKPLPAAAYMTGEGTETSLANLKGQWLLLNLWASWCAPCLTEMPSLETLSKEYSNKGLQVVAISLDEAKDWPAFKEITGRLKFGPVATNWDHKGELYEAFNPPGLPVTYLVDPAGRIRETFEGERDWSSPAMRTKMDQILNIRKM